MGIGPSYKMSVVVPNPQGRQSDSKRELDWIARPPPQGESRNPPVYERELVAGGGLILGKGAFGVTRLAQSLLTGEYYAVKVLSKTNIFEKKSVVAVQGEVDVLARMQHPFIIHLFGAYQDEFRVVLVMEYAAGGELLHRIREGPRLPDGEAKFYAAEIADALHYMHSEARIIYHDLKPENIMLAADGHVRVVDFGLALAIDARQYDETRIGTSMYMAPELANHRVQGGHAPAVDWWSFGCVTYEMLSGVLPFGDSADLSKYEIYTNITSKKLRFGKGFASRSRHILTRLLDKNPNTRMGWEGVQVHRWFKNVDWVALREQRIRPPWVPAAHMKPGHTGCFLTWKTEPEISEKEPPSEQVQGYSRIKLPGGCALRAPQPQNATGKRKGNGSASDNFHRVVLEALANPATGARCSAMQRRSGGVGVGGSAGGGVSGSRGSRDSIVIGGTTNGGSGGGGNAKRRFRSAGCRVVAGAHNLDGQSGRHQKERKSSSTMGGGAGHTNNITTAAVSPRSRGVSATSGGGGSQAASKLQRGSSPRRQRQKDDQGLSPCKAK